MSGSTSSISRARTLRAPTPSYPEPLPTPNLSPNPTPRPRPRPPLALPLPLPLATPTSTTNPTLALTLTRSSISSSSRCTTCTGTGNQRLVESKTCGVSLVHLLEEWGVLIRKNWHATVQLRTVPRHTIILYSRGQNRTPLTGWMDGAPRESLSVLARIGAPLKTRPCTVENTERRNWALQKVDVPR